MKVKERLRRHFELFILGYAYFSAKNKAYKSVKFRMLEFCISYTCEWKLAKLRIKDNVVPLITLRWATHSSASWSRQGIECVCDQYSDLRDHPMHQVSASFSGRLGRHVAGTEHSTVRAAMRLLPLLYPRHSENMMRNKISGWTKHVTLSVLQESTTVNWAGLSSNFRSVAAMRESEISIWVIFFLRTKMSENK